MTTLLFAALLGTGLLAQGEQAPAANQPPRPAPLALETDARQVREQLREILNKYPPEVGRILKMDPTMLSNQPYLEQYPAVQQFLAAHPEIARNPGFYLEFVRQSFDYTVPTDPRLRSIDIWSDFLEGTAVFVVIVFISSMVAWLVRTLLHHRRWLRTSRIQTEVHNKLLDRFASTNELLTYVQSSAGRRFLEAAPIPVEAATDRPIAAPLNRILWSVQAGIILVIGGFGFQYVSGRVIEEVAQGMWTLGVLATAFGLGFIAAGAFSFVMSRRLGLLDPPAPLRDAEHGDSPVV
ncbi:MAG TPA: hypothetical protein VMO26_21770 [Vicinamibacterales bacterium]|nr:hypothetical protein [Vicinamibacterales bacterium]